MFSVVLPMAGEPNSKTCISEVEARKVDSSRVALQNVDPYKLSSLLTEISVDLLYYNLGDMILIGT